jgi:hypothetical protein
MPARRPLFCIAPTSVRAITDEGNERLFHRRQYTSCTTFMSACLGNYEAAIVLLDRLLVGGTVTDCRERQFDLERLEGSTGVENSSQSTKP